MKQVLIRRGEAVVEEVPAPMAEKGTIVVAVDHSCISIGTEMSGVQVSGEPLWKKALKNPDKVAKAMHMAVTQGIGRTTSAIQGQLTSGDPTGYSASGVVLEVGDGIGDVRSGDRVACAGAQCAHHAEIIRVPRNLVAPVPENLSFAEASTVTLGAIALQGVRRATPTLGETFAVIGLGILGQLTVQFLKANGCRVIGTDLDRARIQTAMDLGMDVGVHPGDGDDIAQVVRISGGTGVDGVIITAATSSDAVMSNAFNMCRKKGRVVLVGDVGLNLNRADFYQKEIDFFISTSYGPGRYDRNYEEEGLDYPISYVRWTENRNMSEYLRLLVEGRIQVNQLIEEVYAVEDAPQAYEDLKNRDPKPLMVLLRYPGHAANERLVRKVPNPMAEAVPEGRIKIAIVGAGGFAKGMHLPNIQSLSDQYKIHAIMSRTGHNAQATARQFSAAYSSTSYDEILGDPDVDAVLIATRHNLHANMTMQALKAGKHVFVEKPLAVNQQELENIVSFYEENPKGPVLLTGFNRRFSPYIGKIKSHVDLRSNPIIVNYRMNAGYIPLDHWVHTEEGAGRNIGEACHIYDLFTYLTNSEVEQVSAYSINPTTAHYSSTDNFVAIVRFNDGSVCTLTYTALGSSTFPKETMEVYVDGKVLVLNDYKGIEIHGAKTRNEESKQIKKGQLEEVAAFAKTIEDGGDWPIPLWQQKQAMEIAFEVETFL